MAKIIISCAVTGAIHTPSMSDYLPITAEEIARSSIDAAEAGAAIIHLHDRDWVFTPAPDQKFQRVEVTSGDQLPNQMEQVLSGLQPGQKVVSNALALQGRTGK